MGSTDKKQDDFEKRLSDLPRWLDGGRYPKFCGFRSEEKAWWQCDKDPSHVWEAQIKNRTILKSGCPICRVGWTVAGIRSFVDSDLKKKLGGNVTKTQAMYGKHR